jgi:tetratricopeptide (TPR) repeat protein
MTTVSLCMIVRDEEAFLEDCLASTRDVVQEIVVVDTGSRDATKRIAAKAGARVFDFPWEDDFAAARNESLRHATGDWILVLDADERLASGMEAPLRAAVTGRKFDCGLLRLHDAATLDADEREVLSGRARYGEVQLLPRLLRRADDLSYAGAIHEDLMPWVLRGRRTLHSVDVDIVHFGSVQQVIVRKGKRERNLRLLRAELVRRPDDIAAWGYLAHELLRMGANDEAQNAVDRGWAHLPPCSSEAQIPIHRLATARAYLAILAGRYLQARDAIRVARRFEPDNPDLTYLEAQAFEAEAQRTPDRRAMVRLLRSARDGYRACLRFGKATFAQSFVEGAASWTGFTRLGAVELLLGRPAKALQAFDAALCSRPDELEALLGRAEARIELGDPAGALQSMDGLLDDVSPDAWALAAWATQSMGMANDARLFARRAHTLSDRPFLAPHRRTRLRDILRRSPTVSAESRVTAGS